MTRCNPPVFSLLLLVLLWAMPHSARAVEDYDNCVGFITSLPAVISTPGTWCLKQDLTTSMATGTAIDIQGNNIVVDCNGFKLGGLAAGAGTQTTGIGATQRYYTTIRNCNVRGFLFGISLIGSGGVKGGGHLVEDNRLDSNTAYGIEVIGDGSVVRRNLVIDTGGSTVSSSGQGIYCEESVDIIDNTIAGVTGNNSTARGIETAGDNGTIRGNQIRGLVDSSQTIGIIVSFSSHASIRNNNIMGNGAPSNSTAIYCSDNAAVAKDNASNGFSSAITACADGGGNDAF